MMDEETKLIYRDRHQGLAEVFGTTESVINYIRSLAYYKNFSKLEMLDYAVGRSTLGWKKRGRTNCKHTRSRDWFYKRIMFLRSITDEDFDFIVNAVISPSLIK